MSEDLKMVGFDTVLRDVAAQISRQIAEAQLPALGEYIAWSMHERGGCTDGLSSAHRVGEPKNGAPYTTCGMPIPAPVRWLSLSPAMIKDGLLPCGFCEAVALEHLRDAA